MVHMASPCCAGHGRGPNLHWIEHMKKIGILFLLLLPVLLALGLPHLIGGHDDKPILKADCPDLFQGCQVAFGKQQVEVRFLSAPTALQRFDLLVKASDAKHITIDMAMQGMNMGPNHYVLMRAADGAWHGKILLPVCVSGTRNWIMTLEIDGVKRQILFVTTTTKS